MQRSIHVFLFVWKQLSSFSCEERFSSTKSNPNVAEVTIKRLGLPSSFFVVIFDVLNLLPSELTKIVALYDAESFNILFSERASAYICAAICLELGFTMLICLWTEPAACNRVGIRQTISVFDRYLRRCSHLFFGSIFGLGSVIRYLALYGSSTLYPDLPDFGRLLSRERSVDLCECVLASLVCFFSQFFALLFLSCSSHLRYCPSSISNHCERILWCFLIGCVRTISSFLLRRFMVLQIFSFLFFVLCWLHFLNLFFLNVSLKLDEENPTLGDLATFFSIAPFIDGWLLWQSLFSLYIECWMIAGFPFQNEAVHNWYATMKKRYGDTRKRVTQLFDGLLLVCVSEWMLRKTCRLARSSHIPRLRHVPLHALLQRQRHSTLNILIWSFLCTKRFIFAATERSNAFLNCSGAVNQAKELYCRLLISRRLAPFLTPTDELFLIQTNNALKLTVSGRCEIGERYFRIRPKKLDTQKLCVQPRVSFFIYSFFRLVLCFDLKFECLLLFLSLIRCHCLSSRSLLRGL